MTESLTLQGRWWLPDHQDHRVFGTLTWDADEGGTLLVQDELRPVVWLDNVAADGSVQKYRADRADSRRTYPLILGQVEHRAYTLLDSFRLSAHEYDMDERVEKVHVNRFLEGAWFDDPDQLSVDRVVIDLRHLTGWVNQSGLKTDHPRREDGGEDDDRFSVVTARTLPPLTVEHGDASVRFTQSLGEEGDHIHELGIRQHWTLRVVSPEERPLALSMATAGDLQDLVSIAVGKTADFEKVCLQHPSLPKRSLAGTPIGSWREDITYYARWSNRSPSCEPVSRHDMYFTLEHLGGMDGVGRWLRAAEQYNTELSRVMATRYSASMFIEDRIMNVSAALDSFDKHRRGDDDAHYVERIKQCVALAGQTFLDLIAQDAADWAKSVKETRHDLAHHREQFRTNGSAGDHLLAEQLFWLFTLCMLRLAEAPTAVFDGISRHGQVRWLAEQARADSA